MSEALSVIHRRAHLARQEAVTEDKTDKRPEVRFPVDSQPQVRSLEDQKQACPYAMLERFRERP